MGGYDGRMVLWDTISQKKKFVYKQHTRSIASMAFHEGLILLFTAAYDHSICVWNPYIQSLVHKISTNVNVIDLQLIPHSNFLVALDLDSNVKIREVNKFTLLSSFPIDKHENCIEPTAIVALQHPLRYYFAGNGLKAYQYVEVQATPLQQGGIVAVGLDQVRLRLYGSVKRGVLVWDLLTGALVNSLPAFASRDITALQVGS